MTTKKSKEELVEVGGRLRTDYLLEQTGYTLGVAAKDGKPLEDLLPSGYLGEVLDRQRRVQKGMEDRTLIRAESKLATSIQHQTVRKSKVWRRKLVRRAMRAARLGAELPDKLLSYSSVQDGPALVTQIAEMTRLAEANRASLHGTGIDELLAEGRAFVAALGTSDADQEQKVLKEVPDALQRYYEEKGRLYVGLKVINDAGHELHADDPEAASRYNLSILHRRAGRPRAGTDSAA